MKATLTISILCLGMVACQLRPDYNDVIRGNVNLIVDLERREFAFEELDEGVINEHREKRLAKWQEMESLLINRNDTLDSLQAASLLALSREGEPYHPFAVEKGAWEVRLQRAKKQLADLNLDLEHNLLPADSVDILVKLEREIADRVLQDADSVLQRIEAENEITADWLNRMDSTSALLTGRVK